MFGIGIPEMLLILAIALIVIGPQKLPDLAKSLGRAMREFKKASTELKDSLKLDEDIDEVRQSFSEFKADLKDSIDPKDPKPSGDALLPADQSGDDTAGTDPKITALEQAYDEWKADPSAEGSGDEADPPAQPSDSDRSPDRTEV